MLLSSIAFRRDETYTKLKHWKQNDTTQVWKDCIAIRMFPAADVDGDTVITLDSEAATVEPLHVDSFFKDDRISGLIRFMLVPRECTVYIFQFSILTVYNLQQYFS